MRLIKKALFPFIFFGSMAAYSIYKVFFGQDFYSPRTEIKYYFVAVVASLCVLLLIVLIVAELIHQRRNPKNKQ